MKILWVTNTIFPDLSIALGKEPPVLGGWMYGLANDLVKNGISLVVATSRPKVQTFHKVINNTTYYLLRSEKKWTDYDSSLEFQWKEIISEVNPDVVHIHGTEYPHGLALMKASPTLKYVISIQGMTSVYTRYYLGGLSKKDVWKNYSLRDFLKQDSLLQAQSKFKKRGQQVEVPYIKKATHIIGRTNWDHDHVKTINPKCTYHFCNESLRDAFYQAPKWNINDKNDYTIFLSQAGYPLKGLHMVIEAINLIKDTYPTIQVRIAGNNISKTTTIKDKMRISGYGKYINKLLKKYNLLNHITFTGLLDGEQMAREYLNSHIFICPSSIENSPNSLGEAQLLGVPCIASYVGGVADMVIHNETGLLYRFEEVEMLAQAIKKIFSNSQFAEKLSKNSIIVASERHSRQTNVLRLMEIYKTIK
ncbi:MAG: glycosyltransferase family 4 protein [Cellulophaga sp.]